MRTLFTLVRVTSVPQMQPSTDAGTSVATATTGPSAAAAAAAADRAGNTAATAAQWDMTLGELSAAAAVDVSAHHCPPRLSRGSRGAPLSAGDAAATQRVVTSAADSTTGAASAPQAAVNRAQPAAAPQHHVHFGGIPGSGGGDGTCNQSQPRRVSANNTDRGGCGLPRPASAPCLLPAATDTARRQSASLAGRTPDDHMRYSSFSFALTEQVCPFLCAFFQVPSLWLASFRPVAQSLAKLLSV